MSNKCCSGDREGRKDKGGGGGSRSKTSCMWRVVCDKVVCMCMTSLYNAIVAIAISTRQCRTRMPQALPSPQCHQKSDHDNKNETSHVDVAKCHACHGKQRWMVPSTTPATQNEGGCHQVPRLHAKLCVKVMYDKVCDKVVRDQTASTLNQIKRVWKMMCDKVKCDK